MAHVANTDLGGGRVKPLDDGQGDPENSLTEYTQNKQRNQPTADPAANSGSSPATSSSQTASTQAATPVSGSSAATTTSSATIPANPASTPSISSSNTQASSTTQRTASGVDMTDEINAANAAWEESTGKVSSTTSDALDTYRVNTEQGINNYEQEASAAVSGYQGAVNGATDTYGSDSKANTEAYEQRTKEIVDTLQNMSEAELADYANKTQQSIDSAAKQIDGIISGLQNNLKPANVGRVGHVSTAQEEALLRQLRDSQQKQSESRIDYAVRQGVEELQRAEADAQPMFQAQRDQIAADEARALDNQALYSEARGDRGGIGQAQYASIQNTAATNQLTVNKEQTKLATDTARQIADLRAKGEFQKADELMSITQSYLSQLMQLKQWADATNVSIDEFNIGVAQWEQEYNAKVAQVVAGMQMDAVQYTTGLRLDNQRYVTGQKLSTANNAASLSMGAANAAAAMRESTIANLANMSRENALTSTNMQLSNLQSLQQQKQNLNNAMLEYGTNNARYENDQTVNRLTSTLAAKQQNAANMTSTELQAASLNGAFSDGTKTLAAMEAERSERDAEQKRLANAATQLIAAGVTPSDSHLAALGWTREQFNDYQKKYDADKLADLAREAYNMGATPTADQLGAWGLTADQLSEALTAKNASQLASAAEQMIAAGVEPTEEQLKALGWTKDQYEAYKLLKRGAGSGGGSSLYSEVQTLIKGNTRNSDIEKYLISAIASNDYSKSDIDKAQLLWNDAKEYHNYQGINNYYEGG